MAPGVFDAFRFELASPTENVPATELLVITECCHVLLLPPSLILPGFSTFFFFLILGTTNELVTNIPPVRGTSSNPSASPP